VHWTLVEDDDAGDWSACLDRPTARLLLTGLLATLAR
jgi:hypothetical protein